MVDPKEMKVYKDGNAWCFVLPDFKNLQASPAVFIDEVVIKLDQVYAELQEQKKQESTCPS